MTEQDTFNCCRAGKTVRITQKVAQLKGGQGEIVAENSYGRRCSDDTVCGVEFTSDDCEYVKQHGKRRNQNET